MISNLVICSQFRLSMFPKLLIELFYTKGFMNKKNSSMYHKMMKHNVFITAHKNCLKLMEKEVMRSKSRSHNFT